ncbi:MAG: Micrococcal nuclease-like protein [Candidatus Nomurabacteria bacterium GW2011_GWC2_39_41]|uniref:Micrococcal nuclease-like protein n=2 Tax=Candidatus Nomuraibacteriota TaxID=1752729 RepID=A0A837HTV9_9BACT|nr:MAG: Micrococcal nuclease-like protein [Candidatus Nomurabacteria bacterium GW2011_GWC2_39_41]KKR37099.1 MAG: Micrococcal nuclease-like protein [Candidatus Nomurabacteria bacterium GW2011_GWE2_40_10]KKR38290.1 MAG: Micrococcal nuclease-like protein [Candidatus Nomurabacteria bacterium GW2011_GWB1_40_11]KKR39824.1 MAG: Micrococcal nuclease-like protein [Parcubacteria group bacterium GW2011_GWC1_40_11]KKR67032.1 MAG: Micrococcal nuclease-like protein [Parcubacteria group bacterium GW2011_GWF1_
MKKNHLYIIGGIIAILIIIGIFSPDAEKAAFNNTAKDVQIITNTDSVLLAPDITETSITPSKFYSVVSVVDGDTIKLNMDGKTETFRLIGIDTPETVDPRKDVQCFGVEASSKAKELLSGKRVRIETDATQGTYDKYNRLLGYIYREDGLFYNKYMIEQGYAHEYTYNTAYKYQTGFKNAQKEAQANKAGLWSPSTCNGDTTKTSTTNSTQTNNADSCTIKGNIGSSKEKIFHVVGCGSYNKTVIDESKGEKWFCSEKEAIDAGWRKALNCN